MEKMTNAKALAYVKANFELPEDVAEKIDNMITSLQKKSANRKPTNAQKKTIELMPIMLEVLTDEGATVSEIQARDERISLNAGVSNQKATSVLKCLVASGKVVSYREGKKSLYRLV